MSTLLTFAFVLFKASEDMMMRVRGQGAGGCSVDMQIIDCTRNGHR